MIRLCINGVISLKTISELKEFKRIAMRSCKTDTSFEAMIEVLKHNHNITEITLQIENTKCNTLNQHKH